MPRAYVFLPFFVPVANVIVDVILMARISVLLLCGVCAQFIPSAGCAKYWSLSQAERGRYNRLVLWYFLLILSFMCVLQQGTRIDPGNVAQKIIIACCAFVSIISDFYVSYMVLLRVAAIRQDANIVLVMRRGFWIVAAITF